MKTLYLESRLEVVCALVEAQEHTAALSFTEKLCQNNKKAIERAMCNERKSYLIILEQICKLSAISQLHHFIKMLWQSKCCQELTYIRRQLHLFVPCRSFSRLSLSDAHIRDDSSNLQAR